jgi:hypothetical protein
MEWLYKTFGFINSGPTFSVRIGKTLLMPSFLNAFIVVVLLFVLVLTMAQVRRHFMTWSFKGAIFGIFLGFLLALTVEGFLVIGGKTAFTEILGWKNAPKPVSTALDAGRERLIRVLGVNTKIPLSEAKIDNVSEILGIFNNLSSNEKEQIKTEVCR